MISKYTRGSTIHRALERIVRQPISAEDLRKQVTKESMPRFLLAVLHPLIKDGFVRAKDGVYEATPAGEERYSYLGAVKVQSPRLRPEDRVSRLNTTYDGEELRQQQNRPAGNDHENYPSRMGDMLFFRDGRVVPA